MRLRIQRLAETGLTRNSRHTRAPKVPTLLNLRPRFGAQQSCGLQVQEDRGVRVLAQNRCRHHWTDPTLTTRLDGTGLAGIGHESKYLPGFQNLTDGHGYGFSWNFGKARKPSFLYLLAAAGIIEFNGEKGRVSLEVGGRIIESKMAVFTDPDKRHVDGRRV